MEKEEIEILIMIVISIVIFLILIITNSVETLLKSYEWFLRKATSI